MAGRRLLALLAVTLVAGAVAWALTRLPGAPAACLPADCDCEAAGSGPIRQPANAWSSLAIAVAGIAVLIASPAGLSGSPPPPPPPAAAGPGSPHPPPSPAAAGEGARPAQPAAEGADITAGRGSHHPPALTSLIAGGALVAAGVAAFLAHAGLTAWTARLDGIAVAVLVGTLVLHGLARSRFYRLPRGAQRKPSPSAAGAAGRGGGRTRRTLPRTLIPWLLLALGGLCWWLGHSGGPWCRPDSLLQAHAAWHLLAAGAIGLWLKPESEWSAEPARKPRRPLASGRKGPATP